MKKTANGWKRVQYTSIPDVEDEPSSKYETITPGTVIENHPTSGEMKISPMKLISSEAKTKGGGFVKMNPNHIDYVYNPYEKKVLTPEPVDKEDLFKLLGEKLNLTGKGIKTLRRS